MWLRQAGRIGLFQSRRVLFHFAQPLRFTHTKAVIESIRESYGFGFTTDEKARNVIQHYQRQQAESLRLLSRDLYSKPTHFILEYIQNADDNEYKPDVSPALDIRFNQGTVEFRNNESGFQEKNVRALCAVGMTTKESARGYIGEKGIGFKSGFTVANRIQVFSNGFQFEFNGEELGQLGFVVPTWLETPPDTTATLIRLFIKPDVDRDRLLHQLGQTTRPELLLFLRQLRHLSLRTETYAVVTERHQEGNRVVLQSKWDKNNSGRFESHEEEYFCHTLSSAAPPGVNRGRQSEFADVTIAFPRGSVSNQHVYAFLPVKDYGLKFILNADFVLATSREHILEANEWNVWLRSCVAKAFVEALTKYVQESSQVGDLRAFEFVPLLGEANQFFNDVVLEIHKLLREPCIPSLNGTLKAPHELMFPPDGDLAELVTSYEVAEATGMEFLPTHTMTPRMEQVFTAIGVQKFGVAHLAKLLKDPEVVQRRIENLKWFQRLYRYLSLNCFDIEDNEPLPELELFRTLPIILLQSGSVIPAVGKGRCYFYASYQGYGFEHELNLIHRDLREDMLCVNVLEHLGVEYTDAENIISHHILQQLNRHKYDTAELYVCFVSDHEDQCSVATYRTLRNSLRLKDRTGKRKRLQEMILPDRCNTIKTEELLGTATTSYLDDAFVQDIILKRKIQDDQVKLKAEKRGYAYVLFHHNPASENKEDEQAFDFSVKFAQWGQFLIKKLHLPQLYTFSENKDCLNFIPVVQDITRRLGAAGLAQLLQLTNEIWSSLEEFVFLYDSGPRRGRPSPFLQELRATPWIATKSGKIVALAQTHVWLPTPEAIELFGDHVEYCAAEGLSKECANMLGIRSELNVNVVLEELQSLKAPIEVFGRIYRYLFREFGAHSATILGAFHTNPLIKGAGETNMFSSLDVLWSDPGALISQKAVLSQLYPPELESFFVADLKVPRAPAVADYVKELQTACAGTQPKPSDAQTKKIVAVYERLSDLILEEKWTDSDYVAWKELLDTAPVFLARGGQWKLASEIFIDDDRYSYLSSSAVDDKEAAIPIPLLSVPREAIPRLLPLLELSAIRRASDCVKRTLASDPAKAVRDVALSDQIRSAIPRLLRCAFARNRPAFVHLRISIPALLTFSASRIPVLTVQRSAGDSTTTWQTNDSCLFENGVLYLSSSCSRAAWMLELAHFMGLDPLNLEALLTTPAAELEELLMLMGVGKLPKEELNAELRSKIEASMDKTAATNLLKSLFAIEA